MQLDRPSAASRFAGRATRHADGHDGPTAADVIAKASEADLANIIYIFGEERIPCRRPRHRRRAQGTPVTTPAR